MDAPALLRPGEEPLAPGVTRMPGRCGGKPCLAGTRLKVSWLVRAVGDGDPAAVAAQYDLPAEVVRLGLAYYEAHREAIDRELADDDAFSAAIDRADAAFTAANPCPPRGDLDALKAWLKARNQEISEAVAAHLEARDAG